MGEGIHGVPAPQLQQGAATNLCPERQADDLPKLLILEHVLSAARRSKHLTATNFIDQSRAYRHHVIFEKMIPKPASSTSPLHVHEFTGLRIPREYDCNNFAAGEGNLCAFDYGNTVPSRWTQCAELQMRAFSGIKRFTPSLPIIDEEYLQSVAVYDAAVHARTYFSMAEFGARWGTWGLRAVTAMREFNQQQQHQQQHQHQPFPYSIYFAEPCHEGCAAIKRTAALNNITNYTLLCENADHESFRDWAHGQPWVDVVHADIQGAEYDLFPKMIHVLNEKAKRVILNLHPTEEQASSSQSSTQQASSPSLSALRMLFHNWTFLADFPVDHAGSNRTACLEDILRHGAHWQDQEALAHAEECRAAAFQTPFGPVLQWDGMWIMDNRAFG